MYMAETYILQVNNITSKIVLKGESKEVLTQDQEADRTILFSSLGILQSHIIYTLPNLPPF